MVRPYNGMLFSNRKELSRTWMNLRNAVIHGISQMQKTVSYDPIYRKYPKKANLWRQMVN